MELKLIFKWEPRSGCFVPHVLATMADDEQMPWD